MLVLHMKMKSILYVGLIERVQISYIRDLMIALLKYGIEEPCLQILDQLVSSLAIKKVLQMFQVKEMEYTSLQMAKISCLKCGILEK